MVVWGATGWGLFPAQQSRLIGIVGLGRAAVALSLNASFMYLGFALGAVMGSLTLTAGGVADLGWVGGAAIPTFGLPALFLANEAAKVSRCPLTGRK